MQLPGTAEPVHSLGKPEKVFNFPVGGMQLVCYTNAIYLQQWHHRILRIPPLAVKANRCASEVFLSTTTLGRTTTLTTTPSRAGATLTPATRTATLTLTSSRIVSTLSTATLRTATLPTWILSRLQGKLLSQRWPRSDQDSGSNQDASTTNRWQSRTSYFHARTRAKYGSNCTPKVQV